MPKATGHSPLQTDGRQFLKSHQHFLNAIAAELDLIKMKGTKADFLLNSDLENLKLG
jgi:hypothetical protein